MTSPSIFEFSVPLIIEEVKDPLWGEEDTKVNSKTQLMLLFGGWGVGVGFLFKKERKKAEIFNF